MFGFVQANVQDLKPQDKERYQAVYCGLCRTLGERHGSLARMGLTYDLTFLALLLSSLYEPEESKNAGRCVIHPCNPRNYVQNRCTEYAADMTVLLVYHKCLDDWKDDRNLAGRSYAALLKKSYDKVKTQYLLQCNTIEQELAVLGEIEQKGVPSPDAGANAFGNLMGCLFIYQNDNWADTMYELGYGLGKFIYLADAAVDLSHDRKHGNYNPLIGLSMQQNELRPVLKTILGDVSAAFESLPLVQDLALLRNILYSGIWIKYNYEMEKERKKNKHGG